jgi:RNA polymerase sigma-70 factor (ECF subfamily)
MVERREEEEPPMLDLARQPAPGAESSHDLARLYREHAGRVLSTAYRVTGSAQDAEDVLQTIFLRVMRRDGRLEIGENPGPYLQRAAINAGLDVIRSRQTARSTPLDDVEPTLASPPQASPARLHDAGEIRAWVRRALALLSPRSAEIFALRYFEGYDNHEIARMLGTSRGTVGVVLHRARQRVREAIRDELGDER